MNTYGINTHFNCRADDVTISLRRGGYTAYVESSECGQKYFLVTDASRAVVLLTAGNGLFLDIV